MSINGTASCPEGIIPYSQNNANLCVWYASAKSSGLAAPCCTVNAGNVSDPNGNPNCYQTCPVTSSNLNQTLTCLYKQLHNDSFWSGLPVDIAYCSAMQTSQGSSLGAEKIMLTIFPVVSLVLAMVGMGGNILI